jgi:hypothetical protein
MAPGSATITTGGLPGTWPAVAGRVQGARARGACARGACARGARARGARARGTCKGRACKGRVQHACVVGATHTDWRSGHCVSTKQQQRTRAHVRALARAQTSPTAVLALSGATCCARWPHGTPHPPPCTPPQRAWNSKNGPYSCVHWRMRLSKLVPRASAMAIGSACPRPSHSGGRGGCVAARGVECMQRA